MKNKANAKERAQAGSRVVRGKDGVYRWVYEMSMLRNPTILFTVWKVMGVAACAPALLVSVLGLFEGEGLKALVTGLQAAGVVLGIMLVLSIPAYLIVAAMNGWNYVVLFEMDDEGVSHIQTARQVKKAELVGLLTTLVGMAARSPTAMGSGLLAGSRSSLYTAFAQVRSVKASPGRHLIRVNAPFGKNQVYVDPEDFQFVLEFIAARCPGAKIRK